LQVADSAWRLLQCVTFVRGYEHSAAHLQESCSHTGLKRGCELLVFEHSTRRAGSLCYDFCVSTEKKQGRFITLEGLDGCGKSTQLNLLAEALRRRGLAVIMTREPGGTPIGEKIRSVLLNSSTGGLSPWAELALMFASRAQHIDELIRPALKAGNWVLCDRFTDSSEAYQGGGRRLGSEVVREMNRIVCRGFQPDLTIYMDSDVGASVDRARSRNKASTGAGEQDENRFEQESRAFFERVRQKFLEIARREPERVTMIDARRSIEVVSSDIMGVVEKKLLAISF
jgi:dTMP kinase